MRKLLPLILMSFALTTGYTIPCDCLGCKDIKPRNNTETNSVQTDSCGNSCCTPCPCAEYKECKMPTECAFLYSYKPELSCDCGWFGTLSFTYWKAGEDNLQLGTRTTITGKTDAGTSDNFDFKQIEMDFEYKPGFKIGLGTYLGCNDWELYAEYTYFRGTSSVSQSTLPANDDTSTPTTNYTILPNWWIIPLTNVGQLSDDLKNGRGSWHLSMDLLDMEVAKTFYLHQCLTSRLSGGLRAAWIRQEYDASYSNTSTENNGGNNDDNNVAFNYSQTNNTKNWGVGPRLGLDLNWKFWSCFRAFIDSSASILFTKYTTDSISASYELTSSTMSNAPQSTTASFCNIDDPFYVLPQTEMTIGLGWGTPFCCDRYFFDLEVGYTFNVFWSQNQFHSFGGNHYTNRGGGAPDSLSAFQTRCGNLYLHGLTITARLDF